jgi:hypothetical protein
MTKRAIFTNVLTALLFVGCGDVTNPADLVDHSLFLNVSVDVSVTELGTVHGRAGGAVDVNEAGAVGATGPE